jgi:hypothetical protein
MPLTAKKKLELQLAPLDTYLVSLPEKLQEAVKAKLADCFFGDLPRAVESAAENS